MIPTGEFIDRYGRLLAYLPRGLPVRRMIRCRPRTRPERRTFNLDMVDSGWAALFLIYPSLPRNDDLNLLLEAAEAAWTQRRGAWQRLDWPARRRMAADLLNRVGRLDITQYQLIRLFKRVTGEFIAGDRRRIG